MKIKNKRKLKLKGNQLIRQLILSSYYYSFCFSFLKSTRLLFPPLPKPFLFILNLLPRRDHPSICQRCNLIGSLLYLEVGGRRSAVGYRLSAIGYWLSAIGYQLSAVSYRLSAVGYRLSAIGYRLSAVGYHYLRLGLTNHWSVSSTHRSLALPDIPLFFIGSFPISS